MSVSARIFLFLGILVSLTILGAFFVYTKDINFGKEEEVVKSPVKIINILAPDGASISAKYTRGTKNYGVVLIHDIAGKSDDWGDLNDYLVKKGFSVLALDLRGHGQSASDYKTFTPEQFIAMRYDVLTAYNYLRSRNESMKISFIGSGFGANLAAATTELDRLEGEVSSLILISPSVEEYGLNINRAIELYKNPVLFLVSKQDTNSYQSSEILFFANKTQERLKRLVAFEGNLHGTALLDEKSKKSIAEWQSTVIYYTSEANLNSLLEGVSF